MEYSKRAKDKSMRPGSQSLQKAQVYHLFLMVNSLIREFTLPVPLFEGCSVSSLSDMSYGNVMGSPLQRVPPEELSLIKMTVGLVSAWLKAARVHFKCSCCCSSATSWSFSCILVFLWAHFLVFLLLLPLSINLEYHNIEQPPQSFALKGSMRSLRITEWCIESSVEIHMNPSFKKKSCKDSEIHVVPLPHHCEYQVLQVGWVVE